jgi:hypothetical protein
MKKIVVIFAIIFCVIGFADSMLLYLPTPATIDATTVNPNSKVKIFMEFYEFATPYPTKLPGLNFYMYAHVNGDIPTRYKLCANLGYTFEHRFYDMRFGSGMMVERTYVNSKPIVDANSKLLKGVAGMVVCYHWSPMIDFAMDTKFNFPLNFNLHYTHRIHYIPICKPGINIEMFPHDILSLGTFTDKITIKRGFMYIVPTADLKIVFNNFGSGMPIIKNYNIDFNIGIFSRFETGTFYIEPQITIPSINSPWKFGARVSLSFE